MADLIARAIANQVQKQSVRKRGAIAFNFDDGLSSAMIAADILEQYGGKGTFNIISGAVNGVGYLTNSQILDLHNRGHEITSHSTSATVLNGLSVTDMDLALRNSQSAIANIIGVNPRTFVYPSGTGNTREHQVSSRYYDRVRKSIGRFMNSKNTFIISTMESLQSGDKDIAKKYLKYLHDNDVNGNLIFHYIGDGPSTPYMTIENFTEIVKYAFDLGLYLLRTDEITNNYNEIIDPWYEIPITTSGAGLGWIGKVGNTIEVISEGGRFGENAVVITTANDWLNNTITYDIAKGTAYSLRVPVKVENYSSIGYISVKSYDCNMTVIGSSQSITLTTNADWTVYQKEIVVPANTQFITIQYLGGGGTFTFGRPLFFPTWAGDWGIDPS